MQRGEHLIAAAAALVLVAGPLTLGLAGWVRERREPSRLGSPLTIAWNWKLTLQSALLYALAFNLTFFIQELFLVLPKALTPGLRPTLFHNNHLWEGTDPIASLFQGTGALAILVSGLFCAQLLRRSSNRSTTLRLFLIWMTFNGLLQSLSQVIVGAINPLNDVGMAMVYLQLGTTAKIFAALAALAAIPAAALWLRRPLLSLAQDSALVAGSRTRTQLIFRLATLPALSAIVLIIPFRVPREFIEVVMVPVVVTVMGTAWLQTGAWTVQGVEAAGDSKPPPIAYTFAGLLALLLVFQLLLRPGVHFY
jgi:hypothetical protein